MSRSHSLPNCGDLPALTPHKQSVPDPEQAGRVRESAMKKLLQVNEDYLMQKVKVPKLYKPNQYYHKMPSVTGASQYQSSYKRALATEPSQPAPARPTHQLPMFPTRAVTHESIYSASYHNRTELAVTASPKNQRKQYQKVEAPLFTETHYQREFNSPQRSGPVLTAKREDSHILGGGPLLQGRSTYKQSYRPSDYRQQPVKPFFKKDHSLFVKVEKPSSTRYQESYKLRKLPPPQESHKPKHRESSLPKGKYETEYKQVYHQLQAAGEQDFSCLDREQMQSYVLGKFD